MILAIAILWYAAVALVVLGTLRLVWIGRTSGRVFMPDAIPPQIYKRTERLAPSPINPTPGVRVSAKITVDTSLAFCHSDSDVSSKAEAFINA